MRMTGVPRVKLSKNFFRDEFRCPCGCHRDTVDAELLTVLQRMRDHFKKRIIITSGCRCFLHNEAVGGVTNSFHTQGKAADFVVEDTPAKVVQAYLIITYKGRYGVGSYPDRTHFDVRPYESRYSG